MSAVATGSVAGIERPPLRRVLVAIGGIYTAQSVIGGMTFQGVPAVLRANGVALDAIGLVSLVMLPWALKFLWSPYVERYRLPPDARRRSRRIVVAGEGIVALTLVVLAAIGPAGHTSLLLMLGLAALASATVDIACDAFAIEQLPPQSRGWGNTAQVGGGYFGMMFGSGVFVVIVSAAGWAWAAIAMAGLIVVLTLPFAATVEPDRPSDADHAHRPNLRFAFARPEIRWGLLLTVMFEIGVRLSQGMIGPFLIDAGIELSIIGMLYGFGGAIAGVIGTFAGGALVRAAGSRRAVVVSAAFQVLTLVALAAAALAGIKHQPTLVSLVVLQTIAMAIGFVALYSLLMGLASLLQAGVDFTLFQCADAAVAGLCGFGGSLVAQHLGYGGCFGFAVILAAVGLAILPIIFRGLPRNSGATTS